MSEFRFDLNPMQKDPGTLSRWTADHVSAVHLSQEVFAPIIGKEDFAAISPDLCVWDAWPVLTRDGGFPESFGMARLWMALATRWYANPDDRHGHARIHLLEQIGSRWRDLGAAMPNDFSPGSREWSGSAFLEADDQTLTLYFTAAGQRGEAAPSFNQRLFEAKATIVRERRGWKLADWRDLQEIISRDPRFYMNPEAGQGSIGTIKAFRDPYYFSDPRTGQHWLFFTGSLASSHAAFNGVIGSAMATGDSPANWEVLPPILSADGLNNELERPHVIAKDDLYYLFWSTQAHVFDSHGPQGPTGLYGMVSSQLGDGWVPLNGSGLVIANPPEAPRQAYSWYVMPDLSVTSFVDDWGEDSGKEKRFGGAFAPFLQLKLQGAAASLVY